MPDPITTAAPGQDITRGRYRFREYHVTTAADPMALPAYEALCVTGEEHSCGAASGTLHTPDELTRWTPNTAPEPATSTTSGPSAPYSVPSPERGSKVPLPGSNGPDSLTAVATATPTDSPAQPRTSAEPETATDLRIRR